MTVVNDNRTVAVADPGPIGSAPHLVTELPGPIARTMIERDERVTSPSYTRDVPLVVKRGLGCVVEDVDGNRFIDFAAGIAVCATGHAHPDVVNAMQRQIANLIHICGSDFYYESMIDVCEKLAAIAPGDEPKRVLLTNSGAECVEAAMKLARWATGRKWLISFHGAFHGRTMGALSLTNSKARQKQGFGPLVPMIAHAPYGNINAVREVLLRQAAPTEVAAIFVEPMLGEGGYLLAPDGFLAELRALCDEHGILMVCDEIQAGIGRTGRMFACEHYGVVPDIICVAKGLASGMPLGAVIAPERIMHWPPGAQGSTFGGNPVACAAALETIRLVESGYMANADTLGKVLRERLAKIADQSPIIGNVRGLGLMNGIDAYNRSGQPCPEMRARIVTESFKRGLILLPCGEHSVRFTPPLCITESELATGMVIFAETVQAITNG